MEQVLEEINDPTVFIELFEKGSLEKRIDLLEEAEWKSNKKITNYLAEKVEQFTPTSNEWYNVIIIELVGDLGLFSESVVTKLSVILDEPYHYLVKLSVLDTVTSFTNSNRDFKGLKAACQKLTKSKRDRLIVRVQAILLLKYFKWEQQSLDDLLISYVSKSGDYRLHLRLYEFLLDTGFESIGKSTLNKLVQLSRRKELGKALEKTLLEVEKAAKL